ncbi:MAG: UDP-N-acetylglucosamine 2-epimerase (hydrolyzing) [Desulfobacteraceae bacterium]|nr:UDP-N-acetylglucosamine 2-epimerase (hydrolyzing) [Desulfobacteraceae bacterium]
MRKICVYTSTRAEYGLLKNLIMEIDESFELQLQLLVSGSHLVLAQGMTIEEIHKDGFEEHTCVDIDLSDDSSKGICRSMGTAVTEYGKFFADNSPDIVVILGDRFEAFCCATAAQICRVPVAHIHGGETTQGVIDEAFRHCITKMAHLHFPSCEEYQNRIIQMGESPENVYNVGALGIENIKSLCLMTRGELEESIGFKLDKPFFLVTFHPVTLENNSAQEQLKELLSVLDLCSDYKIIFTSTNADTGGQVLNQIIAHYQKLHPDQCLFVQSLGYLRYLSAMKLCEAVIGNSSSGVLEAPALRVPTINIGDRQKGRIRMDSVIDCEPSKYSIQQALKSIYENTFQAKIRDMIIPFEKFDTSIRIKKILQHVGLTGILKKKFFDFVPEDNSKLKKRLLKRNKDKIL